MPQPAKLAQNVARVVLHLPLPHLPKAQAHAGAFFHLLLQYSRVQYRTMQLSGCERGRPAVHRSAQVSVQGVWQYPQVVLLAGVEVGADVGDGDGRLASHSSGLEAEAS